MNHLLYILTHQLSSAPLSAVPRVDKLVKAGLVRTVSMMVSTKIPERPEPIEDLQPGTRPNYDYAAHILQHRWEGPRRATKFALATRLAVRMVGGSMGRLRASDADHDYLQARVFFSLPNSELWHPEFILDDIHWVPDAVLLGEEITILEIGGSSYTADRLEARHEAAIDYRRILY
jgi:hypothetical protein